MARIGLSEAAKKRVKAGRMLLAGKGCTEVALAVDVARQTVYTCKRLLNEGGIDALGEVPERGCPAQLDGQQLAALRKALLQSPTEHGFGTELWTLKRVRAVIESQQWRAVQPSTCLAHPWDDGLERNEDAVRNWKRNTWPRLKEKPGQKVE